MRELSNEPIIGEDTSTIGWTLAAMKSYVDTLVAGDKNYFNEKIEAFDRRYHERHLADLEAIENHINLNDQRYEQRYRSQEANLITAITAQEKAVAAALQAAKEAVGKAEAAAEKRFDAVNEFRGQLSDQARTFMPRAEAELMTAAVNEKIDNIQGILGSLGGRSEGVNAAVAYVFAAVGALVGVAGLILAFTR